MLLLNRCHGSQAARYFSLVAAAGFFFRWPAGCQLLACSSLNALDPFHFLMYRNLKTDKRHWRLCGNYVKFIHHWTLFCLPLRALNFLKNSILPLAFQFSDSQFRALRSKFGMNFEICILEFFMTFKFLSEFLYPICANEKVYFAEIKAACFDQPRRTNLYIIHTEHTTYTEKSMHWILFGRSTTMCYFLNVHREKWCVQFYTIFTFLTFCEM